MDKGERRHEASHQHLPPPPGLKKNPQNQNLFFNSSNFSPSYENNFSSLTNNYQYGSEFQNNGGNSKGVIEPMIENLVGYVGLTNGAYSHFGPPTSSTAPSENSLYFQSCSFDESLDESEVRGRGHFDPIGVIPIKNNSKNDSKKDETKAVEESLRKSNNNNLQQQPVSTKPSYLEILTKSNQPSSSTPSSSKAPPLFQLQNQSQRKSLDNLIGFQPLPSSPSSSSKSSTASLSPVTKPKVYKIGKENSASLSHSTPPHVPTHKNSKNSTSRPPPSSKSASSTPNTTPLHQTNGKNTKNVKETSSSKIGSGKSFLPLGGRGNVFEFEIEDLDEVEGGESFEKSNSSKRQREKRRGSGLNNSNAESSLENKKEGTQTLLSLFFSLFLNWGRRGEGGSGERKTREKERSRSRKEERNCLVRRFRLISKFWLAQCMKALAWFWTLLSNVFVLSLSVGYSLTEDLVKWWQLVFFPELRLKTTSTFRKINSTWRWILEKLRVKRKVAPPDQVTDSYYALLSTLGPEKNIVLPTTGDAALRRLFSVKGKDPYTILGLRSDSTEETIRHYYKRQAVLVHPDKNLVLGAEEAFKILANAFESVGEPSARLNYHKTVLQAHAKERFIGEFGPLFEKLRQKMEMESCTIRCTKCNGRHNKKKSSRPLFAARYCAQCRIHHATREGEIWVEKSGLFGLFWNYYACLSNQVWEINEWGRCQRSNLKNLKPNTHIAMYRLISQVQQNSPHPPPNSKSNGTFASENNEEMFNPEMEEWDTLLSNLYRHSSPPHSASSPPPPPNSSKGGGGGGKVDPSGKKRKNKRK